MEILKKLILLVVFFVITGVFFCAATIIYQTTNPTAVLKNLLISKNGKIKKAFFSPQDQIKDILINLVDHEQERISIAIYTLTENDIAQALIRAFKRGVYVELVVDRCYGSDRYSKIPLLANNRIFIKTYQCQQGTTLDQKNSFNGLMHNKFLIFKKNIDNHSIIFTGSFNLTKSANLYNQENVVILNSPTIFAAYEKEFHRLKEKSIAISGTAKNYAIKNDGESHNWWDSILKVFRFA